MRKLFNGRDSSRRRPRKVVEARRDKFVQLGALLLQALPLLTFVGLLLGICYMQGYLGKFSVSVLDVASTTDFLRSAIFGLGIIASALFFASCGFLIGQRTLASVFGRPVWYIILLISVVTVWLFDGRVSENLVELSISGRKVDNFWYSVLLLYYKFIVPIFTIAGYRSAQVFSCFALIFSIFGIIGSSSLASSRLFVLAPFGSILLVIALALATSTAGEEAARSRYRAHFTGDPAVAIIPALRASSGGTLPESCQCGAFPLWSGDRASALVCDGSPIIVQGPENLTLRNVAFGQPELRGWAAQRSQIGTLELERMVSGQCASARKAEVAFGGRAGVRSIGPELLAKIPDTRALLAIGLVCGRQDMFIHAPGLTGRNDIEVWLKVKTRDPHGYSDIIDISAVKIIQILNSSLVKFEALPANAKLLSMYVDGEQFDLSGFEELFLERGCLTRADPGRDPGSTNW